MKLRKAEPFALAYDFQLQQDLEGKGWSFRGIVGGRYRVHELRNDVKEWVHQQDPTKWTRYEVEYSHDVYHFSDELMMLLILRWS